VQPRLLVLCRYDSAEALAADRIAGRQMLWGLGERGIRWQLHQPWLPAPDLAGFDAILCWSYRWHANNYIFYARAVTDRAAERGLPVVNPVERANAVHSHFLTAWNAAGIPCARCRRFARFDDFGLPYPLILRRDGVHMGEDVHLARTPEEARALIEERRQALSTAPRGERPGGPLDLAVEFIDTRDAQGIYRKWRSYVIGDRVIPRLLELSGHWLVNFGSLIEDAAAAEEDRAFVRGGEPNPELVRAAARLTGADVVALDYARRPDGGYVFWEANRHFLMLGDPGYERPERMQAATGRSDEERQVEDRSVGLAIADLVLERIAAAAR
jgi:hypothetical protein